MSLENNPGNRESSDARSEQGAALFESEQRFRLLVQGVRDAAIYMLDTTGRVSNWNSGAELIKGYSADEIVGEHFSRFYTEEDRAAGEPQRALETALNEGKYEREAWRVRKDGSLFWAHVLIDPIFNEDGVHVGFAKVTRDATERKRTQEQLAEAQAALAQAQKLQALGELAGGVAHDFNNLMTVIVGSADFLRRRPNLDPEKRQQYIEAIFETGTRATKLTDQLLAFGRRRPLRPEVIDVNATVDALSHMLRRALGSRISVELDLGEHGGRAEVDVAQFETAILNAAVNARDAMPRGGTLTICTELVPDLAGELVAVRIRDTGLGMPSRRQHAILLVRHTVINAVREFLNRDGFVLCDTPILTPAACEGTTTLFEVDYFNDEKAYLSQSGQLYNEATAAAFGKVYAFGPTFRAERSKTRRHLTEFWMVEPEMAYATLDDVMDLSERFLSAVAARVLEERREELKILERDTSRLENITPPFPRLHYDEAVRILHEGHERGELEQRFEWGGDFGSPDETYISSRFDRPVMVHRYPAAVKAFYMKRDPERDELALGVDVLAPEGYGEVIGGGERATSLEFLEEQLRAHELPREAFEWYLDLRRYGSVPHAGFGMGIERCVAWMCGIEHIRETIPFPRMLYRLRP